MGLKYFFSKFTAITFGNRPSGNSNGPSRRLKYKYTKLCFLYMIVFLSILALSGCDEETEDTTTSDDDTASQTEVDSGKAQLETLLTQENVDFGEQANVAAVFASALSLSSTNQEAIFYAGVMQVINLLDSSVTTAIMAKAGMSSVRDEDVECLTNDQTCFEPVSGTYFGGTDANLTFADAQAFWSIDFLNSLSRSADLLDSLPVGFTSTLNIPDEGSTTRLVEFDYTDAKIFSAVLRTFYTINAIPWIWNFPGVDNFLTANGDRDETSGNMINITDLEIETELKSNTAFLGINQTGVDAVTTALANIFGSLNSGIDSLLAESDSQSDDFITTSDDQPAFDDQELVTRFALSVHSQTASSLRDSFESGSGATTVILYDPVAFITNFLTCVPIAGAVSDTDPFNHSFSGVFSGTLASSITLDEDLSVLDGTTPENQSSIPTGAIASYIFKFTLSAPANLSIYTRGTDINTNIFIGYNPGGVTLEDWDTDLFRKWFPGPSGLSIAVDYFQGSPSLPITGPIEFYVKVTNLSSTLFTLHVTTDLDGSYPADAPIFLTGGGGRNFTTKVFSRSEKIAAGNIMQVLGDFGNNVNRTTLVLDVPATTQNESFLEFDSAKTNFSTELMRVLPDATFTETDFDGDQGNENLAQDSFLISPLFAGTPTDVTASFPGPPSFCAPPMELSVADDIEGGFFID